MIIKTLLHSTPDIFNTNRAQFKYLIICRHFYLVDEKKKLLTSNYSRPAALVLSVQIRKTSKYFSFIFSSAIISIDLSSGPCQLDQKNKAKRWRNAFTGRSSRPSGGKGRRGMSCGNRRRHFTGAKKKRKPVPVGANGVWKSVGLDNIIRTQPRTNKI